MAFANVVKKAEHFTSQNSEVILTSVGIVGVVSTAYLTGRTTLRRSHILLAPEYTSKEKAKLVYRDYIPAVSVGLLTVTSMRR